jgi:hypothetical protein
LTASCGTSSSLKNFDTKVTTKEYLQDSLAFEICQMYGLDQGVRLSPGFKGKWDFIDPIDSLNFTKVINFVKKNGYPTAKLLGRNNYKHECVSTSFHAILLHNPVQLVKNKEYFNLFLEEVNKGNLSRELFATMLDKYYWLKKGNNGHVLYGSQFGKPCIQSKEETNKARQEIGLNALSESEFIDCSTSSK